MIIENFKWFFISYNSAMGGNHPKTKTEYVAPYGEPIITNGCSQVGLAYTTFSAGTGILNPPTKKYGLLN